jgi:hypothetical protein
VHLSWCQFVIPGGLHYQYAPEKRPTTDRVLPVTVMGQRGILMYVVKKEILHRQKSAIQATFVFTEIITQKHGYPLLNQPSDLECQYEFVVQPSKKMVHLREYGSSIRIFRLGLLNHMPGRIIKRAIRTIRKSKIYVTTAVQMMYELCFNILLLYSSKQYQ